MMSNGWGTGDSSASRDDAADWLYFGTNSPDTEPTDPLATGVSPEPHDTALIPPASPATPVTAPSPADTTTTVALPPASPTPATTQVLPPAAEGIDDATGRARRTWQWRHDLSLVGRDLLSRGVRRAVGMAAVSLAVMWLSTSTLPAALPVAVSALLLTMVTLAADVASWILAGRPYRNLLPTTLPWLLVILAAGLTLGLLGSPADMLILLGIAYVAGAATHVGLRFIPMKAQRPILSSAPVTVALFAVSAAVVPLPWAVAWEPLETISVWTAPLVDWLWPSLTQPWPWSLPSSLLLALVTAVFLTHGTQLAASPIRWKAPLFLGATAMIAWAFLAFPYRTLPFLLVAAVLAFFVLGRR